MLKKVFKYDFQAIKRYWWLLAAIIPGVALVAALLFRFALSIMSSPNVSDLTSVIATMELMLAVIMIALILSSFIVTEILLFVRFYKHFFSDEGYLTFTLPVSRRTLFLSKTLNAMVWSILHIMLIGLAVIICCLIIPIPSKGVISFVVFEGISTMIKELWELFGPWLIVYIIEGVIIALLYLFFTTSLIHMCITIGAVIAKRAKLFVGIALWYGITAAISFVSEFLISFGLGFALPGFVTIASNINDATGMVIFALFGMLACLTMAALGFIFYSITIDKIERKLNLA